MATTGATQTNVKRGIIKVLANESLVGKEGRLVKIVNDTGVAEAALPSAQNDLALYIVVLGAAAGEYVELQPLFAEEQARVRLNGTINPGIEVVLDVGASGDYGKVKAIPSVAGLYLVLGTAEQVGVDEQLLLIRPNPRMVRVASANVADVAATTTATAAALTGTLTGTVNGALVDIAATAGACEGAATPTATQVDAAIARAVATIVSGANEQIKELQTMLNAAIADVGSAYTRLGADRTAINALNTNLEAQGIQAAS